MEKYDVIENFLIQEIAEKSSIKDTLTSMSEISGSPIPDTEMV